MKINTVYAKRWYNEVMNQIEIEIKNLLQGYELYPGLTKKSVVVKIQKIFAEMIKNNIIKIELTDASIEVDVLKQLIHKKLSDNIDIDLYFEFHCDNGTYYLYLSDMIPFYHL